MSADRWSRCPICVDAAGREWDEAHAALCASYGEIPAEQWLAERATVPEQFDPYSVKETFREDWEVGLGGTEPDDREALISYSGRCSECGASATFKTTIEVKP